MKKEGIIVMAVVFCFFSVFIVFCISNKTGELKTEKRFKLESDYEISLPCSRLYNCGGWSEGIY